MTSTRSTMSKKFEKSNAVLGTSKEPSCGDLGLGSGARAAPRSGEATLRLARRLKPANAGLPLAGRVKPATRGSHWPAEWKPRRRRGDWPAE